MNGVVPVVQADRARCVHCRQPFDKHLPDMDRPDDWRLRVCPRAPTKAERYSPDTEHREMVAETARLEAEIERRDKLLREVHDEYGHRLPTPLINSIASALAATPRNTAA